MSPSSPQEDFLSAALRHARDAEHMVEPLPHPSPDQAWHLGGFAHECARKACLSQSWVAKVLGHDFGAASEAVPEVAMALDPHASRYPIRDWRAKYPQIEAWAPDHRYERTGSRKADLARALVAEARTAVTTIVVALYLDGRVSPESLET